MSEKKLKLSKSQSNIIKTLQNGGKIGAYRVRIVTRERLIAMNLIRFNDRYDELILTELGKSIEL